MKNDDYKHNLYKELYYNELELKDKITNRVNFAFGIISFISAGVIFVFNKIILCNDNINAILFWISLSIISLSFLISVFLLFKSYFGYSYDYIPSADIIDKSIEEFKQYYYENIDYFNSNSLEKEDVISNCIKTNMIKLYCNVSTTNRNENLRKSKWLRWFGWSICFLLFILLLSYILVLVVDNETEYTKIVYNNIIHMVRR